MRCENGGNGNRERLALRFFPLDESDPYRPAFRHQSPERKDGIALGLKKGSLHGRFCAQGLSSGRIVALGVLLTLMVSIARSPIGFRRRRRVSLPLEGMQSR